MTDKELFEKLCREGECWHEFEYLSARGHTKRCVKCSALDLFDKNPDFTTWEGFGWLWERAIEKDWWKAFWRWYFGKCEKDWGFVTTVEGCKGARLSSFQFWQWYLLGKRETIINLIRFVKALKEYLKEQGDAN